MFCRVLLILISIILFYTENLVMPYYQFVHGKVLFIGGGMSLLDGVLVYRLGVPCVGQAAKTHGNPPASTSQWWPLVALLVWEVLLL